MSEYKDPHQTMSGRFSIWYDFLEKQWYFAVRWGGLFEQPHECRKTITEIEAEFLQGILMGMYIETGTQMLERVRASLQARAEGRNEGGDIEVMKAVDDIVRREGHYHPSAKR